MVQYISIILFRSGAQVECFVVFSGESDSGAPPGLKKKTYFFPTLKSSARVALVGREKSEEIFKANSLPRLAYGTSCGKKILGYNTPCASPSVTL